MFLCGNLKPVGYDFRHRGVITTGTTMNDDSHLRQRTDFAGLLKEPGHISPDDVRYFRSDVFRDGVVSAAEAEALFAMNAGVADKCPEWDAYFVEALTLYVVDQAEPRGYVTSDNAQWLIDCIARDGRVEPANELELLVKILDRSQSSPELLVGFALKIVARAVLEGEGPLASGRVLHKGVIGEAEVELHPPHSIRLRRGERRIDLAHRGGDPVRSQRPHLGGRQSPGVARALRQGHRQLPHGRRNRPGAFADRGDSPRGMASGR